jgi:non-heme chloroperoxidase
MNTIITQDRTEIYFKDSGRGRPIVFSHGWPLSADAWDEQLLFLAEHGYRVIAHDRRGHGRSTQTWNGNDMDTYAADLHALMETMDLRDAILIGHSTGGGEVVRYIGRYGTSRVAKLVLIGAVTPLRLKTPKSPAGTPMEIFDGIRTALQAGRSDFYRELSIRFFGYNRPHATVSTAVCDTFWWQAMCGGLKAQLDCVRAFSETDFTEDLARVDVPTLILHGDDDQMVPLESSAVLTANLVEGSTLKVYPGGSHGICTTAHEQVNADLLAFVSG